MYVCIYFLSLAVGSRNSWDITTKRLLGCHKHTRNGINSDVESTKEKTTDQDDDDGIKQNPKGDYPGERNHPNLRREVAW